MYAAMAQLVEHILGKDEVPGPNPGSSSRQPRREIFGALAFYRLLQDICGSIFCYTGLSGAGITIWSGLCAKGADSVRIPRSKIGKLVCQTESVGIFA